MVQELLDVEDYVVVTGSDGEDSNLEVKPEVLRKIKQWLSPTDFESETSEYHKHLNAHVQGTGQWILETEEFQKWHQTDQIGDLWIRGIPGSGKSVVAASLIKYLRNKDDTPVLFFFFRHIIASNRSPESLIRDCMFQLLEYSPSLQLGLAKALKNHASVQEVPFDELWKQFAFALRRLSKVYCVIDALDEMDLGTDSFLQDLLDLGRQNSKSIKLALTSRQLPYLEAHLKGCCLVDLRLDRKHVDGDISIYISHKLAMAHLDLLNDEVQSIKKAICDRGKGLFLYARLMMDKLLQDQGNFISQLEDLPDGLSSMYTKLLRENSVRSGTDQEFQKLVLQWVTHSIRPLRLIELAAMINALPDRGGLTPDQDAKFAIRSTCGPLLEVCEDEVVQIIHHSFTEFLLDMNESHVKLSTGDTRTFPVLDSLSTHRELASTCIKYLTNGCFSDYRTYNGHINDSSPTGHQSTTTDQKSLMLRYSFLQYSAEFWHVHAAKPQHEASELFEDLDNFLQEDNLDFLSWREMWAGMKSANPGKMTPLHIAACCGLRFYVDHLLKKVVSPDIEDQGGRTPLAYAAIEGHPEIATSLLKAMAKHNLPDCTGLAPMHYAAKMNHAAVIKVLLKYGADANIPQTKEERAYAPSRQYETAIGRTPLYYCCVNGHVEATRALQSSIPSSELFQGLHWAAGNGRSAVVEALLQIDEVVQKIDEKDFNGNTPLYLACCRRDPTTVRVLLEYKPDITVRSEDTYQRNHLPKDQKRALRVPTIRPGFAAIHGWAQTNPDYVNFASRSSGGTSLDGIKQVLDMLLEAGANINEQDGQGRTALFIKGDMRSSDFDLQTEAVSLLLERGANPTLTDIDGSTPLHYLIGHPHQKRIFELFLNAGLSINYIRKSDGFTPLMVSAQLQLMNPQLFHDFGANFDLQDNEGNTAFHYACNSWCMKYKDAVKWISFGNPAILNKAGKPAMTNFRWGNGGKGRVRSIALMVEKGLDLESRDYLGRTPLLNCLNDNNMYFVEELLRLGADGSIQDHKGKTVLHLLVGTALSFVDAGPIDVQKKKDAIKMLIKGGAKADVVDYSGNNLLHEAVSWSMGWRHAQSSILAVAELELVPLTATNHVGRTVLHLAAEMPEPFDISACSDEKTTRLNFLLQSHLKFDVNAPDFVGVTPLHLAAATSEINVWKLIKAGARIDSCTLTGRTPLHFAAEAGCANIVGLLTELLCSQSLSLDIQDSKGRTALHEAARSGRSESVTILLNAGADTNLRDGLGGSVLHAAAEFDGLLTARYERQQYDAKDIDFKLGKRHSPGEEEMTHSLGRIISSEEESKNIRAVVQILLAAGIDPGLLDKSDFTASDLALSLGNTKVVEELAPRMAILYTARQAENSMEVLESLTPLDPFGELMCNFTSRKFQDLLDSELDWENHQLLERIISSSNDDLVEYIVRTKRVNLVSDDGTSPLHLLARWGFCSLMERLLPYVKNINALSPPLLHAALERSLPNIEMVKVLIKAGVSIDATHLILNKTYDRARESFSLAAIHVLATGKFWWYKLAIEELLQAGADIEIHNYSGETALQMSLSDRSPVIWGCRFWSEDQTEILLKYGANVNVVAKETGLTPLNCALSGRRGNKRIKSLLGLGANLSLGRMPAIVSAIDAGDVVSLEMLLEAGANPNVTFQEKMQNRKEFITKTPLQSAASQSWSSRREDTVGLRKRLLQLLIEYGADPLLPLLEENTTPLHEIASENHLVDVFCDGKFDLETKDSEGRTPLHRACAGDLSTQSYASRNYSAAKVLITAGANIEAVDNNGLTPLHHAVESLSEICVKALLVAGASATAKDNKGLSTLFYALSSADDPYKSFRPRWAIEMMLDAGADPLQIWPDGRTLLHFIMPKLMTMSSIDGKDHTHACYSRPEDPDEFVEYSKLWARCLKAGCDREAKDECGNTPLFAYVATVKQYSELDEPYPPDPKEIRKMFSEHDIFAENNAGDTLLHVIASREDSYESPDDGLNLFKMLVEMGLDPRKENKNRLTPLDVAAACGNDDILALYSRDE
ncbi:ankyrin repeat-containing domain protein [Tricladium varicosporioides]|nr:ankyrin repeat-containing domain protein [Hymenoscyphus varicosporioides]